MPADAGKPPEGKTRLVLPSMTVRGAAAKQLAAGYAVGDEFEARVKCKVVEIRDTAQTESRPWAGESSCEIEISDLTADNLAEGADDTTSEEAVDNYRRGKQKAAPPEGED